MIFNLIRIHAIAEKRQELVQTMLSMADSVRRLNGCLSHHLYQDIENEEVFSLIQQWESQENLEAYLRSDLFLVLKGAMNLLSQVQHIQFNLVSQIDSEKAIRKAQKEKIQAENLTL